MAGLRKRFRWVALALVALAVLCLVTALVVFLVARRR